MANRITISDVAREAGVSLMTVSRVVNNKEGVSQDTRQQILEIIEKMGYRPSSIARSLVTRRTGTLGLIVPDIANPYFSSMAHGVAEVAYAQGFSVLLCDAEEKPQRELDLLEVLAEKQVDGVLLAAPRQEAARLLPKLSHFENVILINRLLEPGEDSTTLTGCVLNDDQAGGNLATAFLTGGGPRQIGFLSGPRSSYGSKRRLEGYRAALAEAGIAYQPELVRACPPTVQGGRQIAESLLKAHPEISALFCFNDMVAIGALQASRELGLDVPRDLAIVGYDDIPMAALVTPALTTVRVEVEDMGRIATQLLIDRLEGCAQGCENILTQPELVVRASAI
jgi:LacI family transcriptional regulator